MVAADYFTKWAETTFFAKITVTKIRDFVYTRIICRFDIPAQLISDNDLQFVTKELAHLCENYGIQRHFVAENHVPANDQVKAINKILKLELKVHIIDTSGK